MENMDKMKLWKNSKSPHTEKRTKERGPSFAWEQEIPDFKIGDMKKPLAAETSFKIIYPSYLDKKLKSCFCVVKKTLKEYGIIAELDLLQGQMSVKTTNKTWDPTIILKAKGIISLLARSIEVENAIELLKDQNTFEIIKIGSRAGKKDRFVKRRERLRGKDGAIHKATQMLTNCTVQIQGKTVAVVGPYKGVQQVLQLVQKTMAGEHPLHFLAELHAKKKLASDDNTKNENWANYLTPYKKRNVKRRVPHTIRKKKEYVPFPPEIQERKEDLELQKGKQALTDKFVHKKKVKQTSTNKFVHKKKVQQTSTDKSVHKKNVKQTSTDKVVHKKKTKRTQSEDSILPKKKRKRTE